MAVMALILSPVFAAGRRGDFSRGALRTAGTPPYDDVPVFIGVDGAAFFALESVSTELGAKIFALNIVNPGVWVAATRDGYPRPDLRAGKVRSLYRSHSQVLLNQRLNPYLGFSLDNSQLTLIRSGVAVDASDFPQVPKVSESWYTEAEAVMLLTTEYGTLQCTTPDPGEECSPGVVCPAGTCPSSCIGDTKDCQHETVPAPEEPLPQPLPGSPNRYIIPQVD
jgi:hypothetical protein